MRDLQVHLETAFQRIVYRHIIFEEDRNVLKLATCLIALSDRDKLKSLSGPNYITAVGLAEPSYRFGSCEVNAILWFSTAFQTFYYLN